MFQMIWFIFQFCHWVIIMKYMKVWPSQIELYFKFHKTEKQLCKSMFETKTTFQLIYKCMFKNTKEKKRNFLCSFFWRIQNGFEIKVLFDCSIEHMTDWMISLSLWSCYFCPHCYTNLNSKPNQQQDTQFT